MTSGFIRVSNEGLKYRDDFISEESLWKGLGLGLGYDER